MGCVACRSQRDEAATLAGELAHEISLRSCRVGDPTDIAHDEYRHCAFCGDEVLQAGKAVGTQCDTCGDYYHMRCADLTNAAAQPPSPGTYHYRQPPSAQVLDQEAGGAIQRPPLAV
eukprot:7344942-Prymnesium_polylepis.1